MNLADWIGLASLILALAGLVVSIIVVRMNRQQFRLSTRVSYYLHLIDQNERALQRLAKYGRVFPEDCYEDGRYIVPPDPRSLRKALDTLAERAVSPSATDDLKRHFELMKPPFEDLVKYRERLASMSEEV